MWPVVPAAEEPRIDFTLYSGTPGVILFLLELHRATGEERFLGDARRGADALVVAIEESGESATTGLWVGLGGQMFTLHQAHLATGETRYREAAVRCLEILRGRLRAARNDGGDLGIVWDRTTDIVRGAAGSGCCLLYAHEHGLIPEALEDARRIGDWLLSQAREVSLGEQSSSSGLKWAMTPDFPRLMPNFSHGTAGNAYFLVQLQDALGRDAEEGRYLSAAERAAAYLLSIADRSNDGLRVFHHEPEGEDLYYAGWCHGPVGTSRLFFALDHASPEGGWSPWLARTRRSVDAIATPGARTPGLWNNVGPCCGTAGIGAFLLTATQQIRENHHTRAQALADDLLQRSTTQLLEDGRTARFWTQAEHRTRPDLLQAQTGFMQGAAGVGLFLLQLDAHLTDRPFPLRFPDDPWPTP